jgi:uncharacterized protein
VIGFYGGEPLLEFDLLRKIIDYSRKYRCKDKIKYNLTTNASMLNEKIIKYFIDNEVSILISLDGPDKENNKCRLYINKDHTYNRIWHNINMIKNINEKYFYKNVAFNAVYTDAHNLLLVKEYFDDTFFKRSSLVVKRATDIDDDFIVKNNLISFKSSYDFLLEVYKHCVIKKRPISKYLKSLFGIRFNRIEGRGFANWKNRFNNIFNCKNICIPGSSRLYLTTDGNFHICEKINKYFPIGNIYRGLNKIKIEDIVNNFNRTVACQCISCQAMNLCEACYVPFCKKNSFVIGNKCEDIRSSIYKDLFNYTSIKEENPDAFN